MNHHGQPNEGLIGALLVAAIGATISLPAIVLALALIPLARWQRVAMPVVAVIGVGVTVLLWSRITGQMEAALAAMRRAGGFWEDPERALTAAWPHVRAWWTMALALGPAGACAIDLFRPRSVEELRERGERRTDRIRARRERRARKAAGAPKPEQHQDGLSTDLGSSRQQHQLKADPNDVRRLQAGMCYALGSGKAQKLQIAAIPNESRHDHRPGALRGAPGAEELANQPPDRDEPIRL